MPGEFQEIVDRLISQAKTEAIRVTLHANQEMIKDDVSIDDVIHALESPHVIEHYPEHQRGACCLVYGRSMNDEALHIVCTTTLDVAIVITVYKPALPKWKSPFQRS